MGSDLVFSNFRFAMLLSVVFDLLRFVMLLLIWRFWMHDGIFDFKILRRIEILLIT